MTGILVILLLTLTIWRVLDIIEPNVKEYYRQKRIDNIKVMEYKDRDRA